MDRHVIFDMACGCEYGLDLFYLTIVKEAVSLDTDPSTLIPFIFTFPTFSSTTEILPLICTEVKFPVVD